MSRKQIYEKLADVFEDVFDQRIALNDRITARDVEGWDSLTHIILISAVEDEFGVKMDMKSVQRLTNVGAMVDLIEELLAK